MRPAFSRQPRWYVASCCFFFSSRRRHTRFDCDWSSDVCSSDLVPTRRGRLGWGGEETRQSQAGRVASARASTQAALTAEDRKSVVEGKRVDLGGRRINKKKKGQEERRFRRSHESQDEHCGDHL